MRALTALFRQSCSAISRKTEMACSGPDCEVRGPCTGRVTNFTSRKHEQAHDLMQFCFEGPVRLLRGHRSDDQIQTIWESANDING
jgi:hypothetical protein